MISKDDIKNAAGLCKVKITEKETEAFMEDFSKILNYVDKLKKVKTDGVDPTYHISSKTQPLRDDIVGESIAKEKVVENAPEEQYGYFKLLKVMD